MKLKFGYKVLITQEFYDWYHFDTPDNPSEGRTNYLTLGEIATIVSPQLWQATLQGFRVNDNERLIISEDERVLTIVPVSVLEGMRRAYLAQKRMK